MRVIILPVGPSYTVPRQSPAAVRPWLPLVASGNLGRVLPPLSAYRLATRRFRCGARFELCRGREAVICAATGWGPGAGPWLAEPVRRTVEGWWGGPVELALPRPPWLVLAHGEGFMAMPEADAETWLLPNVLHFALALRMDARGAGPGA